MKTKGDVIRELDSMLNQTNKELSRTVTCGSDEFNEGYLQGRVDTLTQAIRYVKTIGDD